MSKNTSRPLKYCLIFILIHWMILFPLAFVVGGHPPIFYAIIDLPTTILMAILKPNGPIIEPIFFIGLPTITYGFVGYIVGILLNKRDRSQQKKTPKASYPGLQPDGK